MTKCRLETRSDSLFFYSKGDRHDLKVSISYPHIKCLNIFSSKAFYFKADDKGYCIIFDRRKLHVAQECFRNLKLMMDHRTKTQNIFRLGK